MLRRRGKEIYAGVWGGGPPRPAGWPGYVRNLGGAKLLEIRELELGKEELDGEGSEVDSDVLILEKGSRLMEQAMREVGRQLALVARVDVDVFTDALLGRAFAVMCQRRAEELDRKVFVFRLPAQ